eukprot:gb/GEZN01012380.1/.p1 GENE.gb/GEZN01012380.1/~~gb/GEZN01012380.1/.p1  ORF type:complete len:302 (-),score=66.09 gb/GEZN01012380.1/:99-1004(-)
MKSAASGNTQKVQLLAAGLVGGLVGFGLASYYYRPAAGCCEEDGGTKACCKEMGCVPETCCKKAGRAQHPSTPQGEVRVSFRVSSKTPDVFSPELYQLLRLPPVTQRKQRAKSDEYLVFLNNPYVNLKFGQGGCTWNLKVQRQPRRLLAAMEPEDWLEAGKGDIPKAKAGDLDALVVALQSALQTAKANSEEAQGLQQALQELKEKEKVVLVVTDKLLDTGTAGAGVVEQIDFQTYRKGQKQLAQRWRSISVERHYSVEGYKALLGALTSEVGEAELVYGGFPGLLTSIYKQQELTSPWNR